MDWKAIIIVFLILLAGCSTSISSEANTTNQKATVSNLSAQDQDFSADYQINSVNSCGVSCEKVNVTVNVTNEQKEAVEFPRISMSVYVIDEGIEFLWFETEDERIDIWSESEWPENISSGERLTYTKEFKIRTSDGLDIILNGDCTVNAGVLVEYSDKVWKKTKKIQIESKQCSGR